MIGFSVSFKFLKKALFWKITKDGNDLFDFQLRKNEQRNYFYFDLRS